MTNTPVNKEMKNALVTEEMKAPVNKEMKNTWSLRR